VLNWEYKPEKQTRCSKQVDRLEQVALISRGQKWRPCLNRKLVTISQVMEEGKCLLRWETKGKYLSWYV
jgi:hypothetical protein